ncbi:MAG: hypothetical protein KJ601_03740, partial [Nanoarchaeota archaeon]|nr:hypothetical protein [Nanoarchaeota archaeon]MBU1703910.1 hypothetical protein [Nanoarchaeota archaeon]
CYIAAKDKETAEGLAAIAEKYLKPPYSHWQNKRTGGVETYTCRYALGLKIYLSDSENGILRSTIMIVDGNTDIFFEPHGIQAQFHGQLSDGLELYARAIETLDKQHESLLALPKSVRDYYGIQAQKASGRLKQVFDCFI